MGVKLLLPGKTEELPLADTQIITSLFHPGVQAAYLQGEKLLCNASQNKQAILLNAVETSDGSKTRECDSFQSTCIELHGWYKV